MPIISPFLKPQRNPSQPRVNPITPPRPHFFQTDQNNHRRRSFQDIFSQVDPMDRGVFDEELAAGEASRAREENRAVENVLGNLQGRGLARSGIALRDIADQVIGPSAERARSLASTFGLERARGRSGFLQSLAQGDQDFSGQYELNEINNRAAMERLDRQAAIESARAKEERRRRRRGGLGGLIAGGIGGFVGGPVGAMVGQQFGESMAG
jgi:hypothetical protein